MTPICHFVFKRLVSLLLIVTFVVSLVITPRVANAEVVGLPAPGTMVGLSSSYQPLMMTGLTLHPENPLLLDFLVNTGDSGMNTAQVTQESKRLIKYFLACLTIPDDHQWVNLSPYEKDRIIPNDLGQTVLGQDMLAQDYILKQLTASLIYPEKDLGKQFWSRVYAKAAQEYGTTQIPVNTFNKVWILPEYANVYQYHNTVMVIKSHLKVMLDEDYQSLNKHQGQPGDMASALSPSTLPSDLGLNMKAPQVNHLGNEIIRQIILPAIEQEVNTGKNFVQLRQIYNSMILAVWFKNNLKQALLNQVYTGKAKVAGVTVSDPTIKNRIYEQYLQAYKKGVFNYIKEESDQGSQQVVPRKYFSGGITEFNNADLHPEPRPDLVYDLSGWRGNNIRVRGETEQANSLSFAQTSSDADAALLSDEQVSMFADYSHHAISNTINDLLDKRGLSKLASHLNTKTKRKPGFYLGLDWGGTNVRVTLVHVKEDGKEAKISEVKTAFTEEYTNGQKSKEAMFDFLAVKIQELLDQDSVKQVLQQNSLGQLNLGFVFSFPTELKSIKSGVLKEWTKGWNVPGMTKKELGDKAPDVVQLLQKAINRNKQLKGRVNVAAILNDTVATLLATKSKIGVILGTGHNIAIEEPGTHDIYNLESGAFIPPDVLISTIDKRLFSRADPKRGQMFEKMIAGKYLIQSLKLLLEKDINKSQELAKLFNSENIDSRLLSEAVKDNVSLNKFNETLSEIYKMDVSLSDQEKKLLHDKSSELLTRAAQLLRGFLLGARDIVDLENSDGPVNIGIDGSVYTENKIVREVFEKPVEHGQRRIKLIVVPDATAIGAAIAAAIASASNPAMITDKEPIKEDLPRIDKVKNLFLEKFKILPDVIARGNGRFVVNTDHLDYPKFKLVLVSAFLKQAGLNDGEIGEALSALEKRGLIKINPKKQSGELIKKYDEVLAAIKNDLTIKNREKIRAALAEARSRQPWNQLLSGALPINVLVAAAKSEDENVIEIYAADLNKHVKFLIDSGEDLNDLNLLRSKNPDNLGLLQLMTLYKADPKGAKAFLEKAKANNDSFKFYFMGIFAGMLNDKTKNYKPKGARFVFSGNIPIGAGTSSSAALDVAVTQAISNVFNLGIDQDPKEWERVSRFAEDRDTNTILNLGTGDLDQRTSIYSQEGYFVLNRFAPDGGAELVELELPPTHTFVVVNSKLPHDLSDALYGYRVAELTMAPTLINLILDKQSLGLEHVSAYTLDEIKLARSRLGEFLSSKNEEELKAILNQLESSDDFFVKAYFQKGTVTEKGLIQTFTPKKLEDYEKSDPVMAEKIRGIVQSGHEIFEYLQQFLDKDGHLKSDANIDYIENVLIGKGFGYYSDAVVYYLKKVRYGYVGNPLKTSDDIRGLLHIIFNRAYHVVSQRDENTETMVQTMRAPITDKFTLADKNKIYMKLIREAGRSLRMGGDYSVSGRFNFNDLTKDKWRSYFVDEPALDVLVDIMQEKFWAHIESLVGRHLTDEEKESLSAFRMMGGGSGGSADGILRKEFEGIDLLKEFKTFVALSYRQAYGIELTDNDFTFINKPAEGSGIVWRKEAVEIPLEQAHLIPEIKQQIDQINSLNRFKVTAIREQGQIKFKFADKESDAFFIANPDKGFELNWQIADQEIFRLFWMYPFVNRIKNGKFEYNAEVRDISGLPGIKKDGNTNNAIHGFARNLKWKILEAGVDHDGVFFKASINTTDDPEVLKAFGPSGVEVTYHLKGNKLAIKVDGKAKNSIAYIGGHEVRKFTPGQTYFSMQGADGIYPVNDELIPTGAPVAIPQAKTTVNRLAKGGDFDNGYTVVPQNGQIKISVDDRGRKIKTQVVFSGVFAGYGNPDGKARVQIWTGSDNPNKPNYGVGAFGEFQNSITDAPNQGWPLVNGSFHGEVVYTATVNAAMNSENDLVRQMISKPLPSGKGYDDIQAIANGNIEVIERILSKQVDNRNPLKPWIAQAFFSPAADDAVQYLAAYSDPKYFIAAENLKKYFVYLVDATDKLIKKGIFTTELNIRSNKNGFDWGEPVRTSFILDQMGIVDRKSGEILQPEVLKSLGLTENDRVGEDWTISDEINKPSWTESEGLPIPLYWVLHQNPILTMGLKHYEKYSESLAVVLKTLAAAKPLSWQVHHDITEAYVVEEMGPEAGLYLGVNDIQETGAPTRDNELRKEKIKEVKQRLLASIQNPDPKIVRLPIQDGVDVPVVFRQKGLQGLNDLVEGINDNWKIPELVAYLMVEGRNVLDLRGLGLVQSIQLKPGDQLITPMNTPHGLFGGGDNSPGIFTEIKATPIGPAHNRISSELQTVSLADNNDGKEPRPGKVKEAALRQALVIMKDKDRWKYITPDLYQHHGSKEQFIGSKGSDTVLHQEDQYALVRYRINPGETLQLNRFNLYSALFIRQGSVEIFSLDGQSLGKFKHGDRVMVLEHKGDLLLKAISDTPVEIFDPIAPLDNDLLPQLVNPAMATMKNQAMGSRNRLLSTSPEGGIDLNAKNLNLQSAGEKENITFNQAMIAQFRRGDFSGVQIKILDVEPFNLMPMLGLKEDESQMQLAKA